MPKSLSCLAVNGSGRRPDAQMKGQRAEDVVRHSPAFLKQPWLKVRLSRQTVGEQVWEFKAAQVWQMQDKNWSVRTYGLIWARNVATGEEKYFLSNASADAKLQSWCGWPFAAGMWSTASGWARVSWALRTMRAGTILG